MVEERDHNVFGKSGDNVEDLPDDFIPEGAWPICSRCITPCDPRENYCPNCDSNEPMNPLASYMPFVRIRFNAGMYGKVWHKISGHKNTSIAIKLFCVFVLIVGAPVLLIVGFPLLLTGKIRDPELRKSSIIAIFVLLAALFLTLIILTW